MDHLVLVGLMGSGKTTVGRLVAADLGWPLRDSDADIAAREGRTVRQLRDALGTEAMHAIEARHLLDSLDAPGPSVICAASSTIDDGACRTALRDPSLLVVWLTATPATGARRFAAQDHRPRYGSDPAAVLDRQAAERGARFRSIDPVEVPTDERAPGELAAALLTLVAARG